MVGPFGQHEECVVVSAVPHAILTSLQYASDRGLSRPICITLSISSWAITQDSCLKRTLDLLQFTAAFRRQHCCTTSLIRRNELRARMRRGPNQCKGGLLPTSLGVELSVLSTRVILNALPETARRDSRFLQNHAS